MTSDPGNLRQRPADLSSAQRARLAQQLALGTTATPGKVSDTLPRTTPLRVETEVQPDGSVRRTAVYPASTGQRQMWFLTQVAKAMPIYHGPSAFHLTGSLNLAALAGAFTDLSRRHDALRTTFAAVDGELFQRVAEQVDFCWVELSVEAAPSGERRLVAMQRLEREACRPFELATLPAWRVAWIRLSPDEHVLLVVLHHLISGGWSRANLWGDLAACYRARVAGEAPPLRDLPVRFADYSAWQAKWLEDGAVTAPANYWKAKLADGPAPVELPTDRPRPLVESFRGGRAVLRLDPALTAALAARAQEESATLFMILLAAFKTLLHRYTGCEDLVVGVPIASRPGAEVEELIGSFGNTLVIRTSLADQPTFREVLRRVKTAVVEAYEHQDPPFERLVPVAAVNRDAGHTPLFQTTFALQDDPGISFEIPEVVAEPWEVSTQTSEFDLSLMVKPSASGWRTVVEYSRDLFDAGRIERMLGHWHVLLEGIAADPDRSLAELPLLTAAERHQLLVEWNQTARAYPRDKCVHHLFEDQVERTPETVAVEMDGCRLTYRELNQRAEWLAQDLRERGVSPETLVGLCLERSPEMVVCLLGILKAGATYVPLDPHFPPARLALILEDAAVGVLITQRTLADRCAGFDGQRLWWDEWQPAATSARNLMIGAPDNAAYVIYTSGSTGLPKGVVVEHRAVVNFLYSMRERPGLGPADVLLAVSTVSFDISVLEIFLPLMVGARIVMVPEALRTDGAGLAALLSSSGASVFQATPTAWQMLLLSGWQGDGKLKALAGGEELPSDLAAALLAQCGEVWNLYGPTETTVYSLGIRIVRSDGIPIGTPVANTRVYVVDRQGQLMPTGIPGELLIGGDGLARGYLNRPELTAERFIPDPFSGQPGARLYRTGDRVRWRPDGNLEFLGRLDQQVKIRGYRVEPGEVEAVVEKHPAVRECVVTVWEVAPGEQQLAGYVIPVEHETCSNRELRGYVRQYLPDYMVPACFELLSKFPLTPSGKVDRRALPAPGRSREVGGQPYAPPQSPMEEALAGIWAEVLNLPWIGRRDNFFELGGHSLQAMRGDRPDQPRTEGESHGSATP
jgi:amino acid adenylation domain-containing protein